MSLAASLQRHLRRWPARRLLHIVRDPDDAVLRPVHPGVELFMLGYAIDTNVRHVRTIVFDQCRTQESRDAVAARSQNSEDFTIVGEVFTDADLAEAIVAGPGQGRHQDPRGLLAGNSSRTDGPGADPGRWLGVERGGGGRQRRQRHRACKSRSKQVLGQRPLPVESRPRVLFNPDTRSANFFIPGLMVVLCQMMATMLSANAIVREKENGTLEQLFMTPVRPGS